MRRASWVEVRQPAVRRQALAGREVAAFIAFVPLLVGASFVSYTLMRVGLLVFGLGLGVVTWTVVRPDALLDRVHGARTWVSVDRLGLLGWSVVQEQRPVA